MTVILTFEPSSLVPALKKIIELSVATSIAGFTYCKPKCGPRPRLVQTLCSTNICSKNLQECSFFLKKFFLARKLEAGLAATAPRSDVTKKYAAFYAQVLEFFF